VVLSAQNRKSLLIPEGFAHGFQTLSEDCELIYLHTVAYHPPQAEGALNVTVPSSALLGTRYHRDFRKRSQPQID